jgi:GPH family glycoside/pentoside/hexuronide:cation symporter
MGGATLSIPVWIHFSKKIEKKPLWLFAKITIGTGFALTFLLGPKDVLPMIIICIILGLIAGCILILNPSMLADTIDYDQFVSGERKEGVYFSVFTFLNKSAMGLSAVLIGGVLQFSGFVPNVIQDDESRLGIKLLTGIFPMLCFFLGAFFLSSYKFNKREQDRIKSKLDG